MRTPASNRKKALIIIDVQPGFIKPKNKAIIKKIIWLLNNKHYDAYIESVFNAEKNSLWEKQQNWILPKGPDTHTDFEIGKALKKYSSLLITKQTKSVFKGSTNLQTYLSKKNIKEVHIVGLDTNDCILASAYEAFDLGFLTYVIEECCQSSSSENLHKNALALLRHQNMTNHSVVTRKHKK